MQYIVLWMCLWPPDNIFKVRRNLQELTQSQNRTFPTLNRLHALKTVDGLYISIWLGMSNKVNIVNISCNCKKWKKQTRKMENKRIKWLADLPAVHSVLYQRVCVSAFHWPLLCPKAKLAVWCVCREREALTAAAVVLWRFLGRQLLP